MKKYSIYSPSVQTIERDNLKTLYKGAFYSLNVKGTNVDLILFPASHKEKFGTEPTESIDMSHMSIVETVENPETEITEAMFSAWAEQELLKPQTGREIIANRQQALLVIDKYVIQDAFIE